MRGHLLVNRLPLLIRNDKTKVDDKPFHIFRRDIGQAVIQYIGEIDLVVISIQAVLGVKVLAERREGRNHKLICRILRGLD
jgi:hypothetical protein